MQTFLLKNFLVDLLCFGEEALHDFVYFGHQGVLLQDLVEGALSLTLRVDLFQLIFESNRFPVLDLLIDQLREL